jgi:hypothetical protein
VSLPREGAANAVGRVIGDVGEDVTEIASGSTRLSLAARAPKPVLGINFGAKYQMTIARKRRAWATAVCFVAEWRAAADEDGHYAFIVALS